MRTDRILNSPVFITVKALKIVKSVYNTQKVDSI